MRVAAVSCISSSTMIRATGMTIVLCHKPTMLTHYPPTVLMPLVKTTPWGGLLTIPESVGM